MMTNRLLPRAFLSRLLPLLILAFAGVGAMAQSDPPARVGSLSLIEGSVVLAPPGDTEWTDAVLNRPITRGDRLWTDRGARAEVHLGSAVLHVDGETFLEFTGLDDQVFQASLNEGTVNARVRELDPGENFEIDTPHLAFRASRPGDYRIDVDPARGTTRVTVRSGIALVYGAGGEAQQLQAGQQIAFTGRDLERVAVQAPLEDGFDRWAADRNRREDESIAARYIPREVVGYHQLDPYGTWAQDPSYGAVWFPRVAVADWAPYRYGHWEWISPWGWTWIDDAPWGFAPFHYGRWTVIGSRWCWVPGRIGPRPIYAPALVAFLGGAGSRSSWNLTIGSSPGIAWYPLAPGEAWRPTYRTSPVYVRNVNRNIFVNNQSFDSAPAHVHRRRGEAVTALRVDDFSRGRPVQQHWRRVNPAEVARAPVATAPSMPEPSRRFRDGGRAATQPRMQPPARIAPPVTAVRPQPNFAPPGALQREPGNRPAFRPREDFRAQEQRRRGDEQRPLMDIPRRQHERAPQVRQEERLRDEQRAQDDQRRQQVQQLRLQQMERARRDQQVQQERAQREQQTQLQAQRQQEEQRRAQQFQLQREHALRQQQAAQERLQQRQHQQALRQQQAMQERQQQREQASRQQQAAQERLQQQQAAQERQQRQPQSAAPVAQPGPPQRGERRERAAERGRQAQEGRVERRSQGDGDGRGRGHGYGRGG